MLYITGAGAQLVLKEMDIKLDQFEKELEEFGLAVIRTHDTPVNHGKTPELAMFYLLQFLGTKKKEKPDGK